MHRRCGSHLLPEEVSCRRFRGIYPRHFFRPHCVRVQSAATRSETLKRFKKCSEQHHSHSFHTSHTSSVIALSAFIRQIVFVSWYCTNKNVCVGVCLVFSVLLSPSLIQTAAQQVIFNYLCSSGGFALPEEPKRSCKTSVMKLFFNEVIKFKD